MLIDPTSIPCAFQVIDLESSEIFYTFKIRWLQGDGIVTSEKARFDQVREDMDKLKQAAMARSSDLKSEVDHAINELKKSELSDDVGNALVKRFSEVSSIAGVEQPQIEDLIAGFEQMNKKFDSGPAVENLKRILKDKNSEQREFETQRKR